MYSFKHYFTIERTTSTFIFNLFVYLSRACLVLFFIPFLLNQEFSCVMIRLLKSSSFKLWSILDLLKAKLHCCMFYSKLDPLLKLTDMEFI